METTFPASNLTPCTERFTSQVTPPAGAREAAFWYLFQGDRLVVRAEKDSAAPPRLLDPAELGLRLTRAHYLGHLDGASGQVDCWCGEIPDEDALPDGLTHDVLRSLIPLLGESHFAIAGRAIQILTWDRTHWFCGQCGQKTEVLRGERARRCPTCNLTSYPRISPAVIIAVIRRDPSGDRILLARNHRFPPGRYSVLAGFVEPGESLEECAAREVCEEVGVRIGPLRYFGSQPWPFPNSLMIAFTAEHAGGEIRLEESELAEADWFGADALPGLPPKGAIAREMIEAFVAGQA
jgi:NAD+ diphosphatase